MLREELHNLLRPSREGVGHRGSSKDVLSLADEIDYGEPHIDGPRRISCARSRSIIESISDGPKFIQDQSFVSLEVVPGQLASRQQYRGTDHRASQTDERIDPRPTGREDTNHSESTDHGNSHKLAADGVKAAGVASSTLPAREVSILHVRIIARTSPISATTRVPARAVGTAGATPEACAHRDRPCRCRPGGSRQSPQSPGPCCPVPAGGPEATQQGAKPCRMRHLFTRTRPSIRRATETSTTTIRPAGSATTSNRNIASPVRAVGPRATAVRPWRSRVAERAAPERHLPIWAVRMPILIDHPQATDRPDGEPVL
jgi:hypothetical protein